MAKIGLIGLGAMGSRMAARLLDAGHTLKVYNRTPDKVKPLVEKGATPTATPKEAAQGSEIVISMVRDDEASRHVWLGADTGAIHGLAKDAVAVESSTLTTQWTHELSSAVTKVGSSFVDAPVIGSRPQAEAGQLIYVLGGAEKDVVLLQPILGAMGGAVHHVGVVGAGTTMKLVVNALFGVQLAALGELLGFVKNANLDSAKVLEVLGATPVLSHAAKVAGGMMLDKKFAPMFPIELVEKDFGYVVTSAQKVKSDTPVVSATRAVYKQAAQQGFGNEHITAVTKLFDK
ncbi:MAG: NAD(P)-dependent oxidoreductase [Trueperaceae bacterium]